MPIYSGNRFKIYTCSDVVTDVDSLAIDFSTGEFILPPIITVTTIDSEGNESADVNVFVSDLTKSTATLNFSAKFTGKVAYIIRERK